MSNDNGYYISAMQATDAPENAEPDVTLQATSPATIPETTTSAEETTEETSDTDTEEAEE